LHDEEKRPLRVHNGVVPTALHDAEMTGRAYYITCCCSVAAASSASAAAVVEVGQGLIYVH